MAKAKKRKPGQQPKKSRAELQAERERNAKRTRLALIIFAIVAAAAILTLSIIAVVNAVLDGETVDVMEDNLGKYIYISPEDYKDYPVSIKVDPVDKTAVESAFMQAVYKLRTLDPEYKGNYPVSGGLPRAIGIGDTVSIRYIGYELGEGGKKLYFDGGCNFGDDELTALGIGSGEFINGFELGLVGKNPADYSSLTAVTDRGVAIGDVVSISMIAIYSDGSTAAKQTYSVVVDPEVCDKTYGSGFASFLVGKELGELKDEDGEAISFTASDVSDGSGNSVYTDISIEKIYSPGDHPLTVDAYFPVSYDEQSLAGKWVKFDVYVEKVEFYTVPAIDESFVTEKLGMSVAALTEYGEEGDSLADCYRAYLKANLEASAESDKEAAIIEAFWEHVISKVKIKRLPRGDVDYYYRDYLSDIRDYYESQSDSYSSLDEFALTYLELDKNADWRAAVRESAETAVAEKLIFYYIVREENLLPSDEEYNEIYERIVEDMLATVLSQMQITEDKYETREEYEAAVEGYRTEIVNGYGEKYFEENVIYEYAMKKIVAMAKVSE